VPNPDPFKARLGRRRRRRKVGDLAALQRKLWGAICEADDMLVGAEADEFRLKAIHAFVQAGMAYATVLEIGEQEARLRAVEEQLGLVGKRTG
jgi:hypothetical protein